MNSFEKLQLVKQLETRVRQRGSHSARGANVDDLVKQLIVVQDCCCCVTGGLLYPQTVTLYPYDYTFCSTLCATLLTAFGHCSAMNVCVALFQWAMHLQLPELPRELPLLPHLFPNSHLYVYCRQMLGLDHYGAKYPHGFRSKHFSRSSCAMPQTPGTSLDFPGGVLTHTGSMQAHFARQNFCCSESGVSLSYLPRDPSSAVYDGTGKLVSAIQWHCGSLYNIRLQLSHLIRRVPAQIPASASWRDLVETTMRMPRRSPSAPS